MPKYTLPRKTWCYSADFKIKAVELSHQEGIQVKQVAEGFDILPFMLSRWRKAYRDGNIRPDGRKRVIVMEERTTRGFKLMDRAPKQRVENLLDQEYHT